MSQLHYETLLVRRQGLTRDLPAGDNEDLRWVANSATLIFGDHDAVLVDTFTTCPKRRSRQCGSSASTIRTEPK